MSKIKIVSSNPINMNREVTYERNIVLHFNLSSEAEVEETDAEFLMSIDDSLTLPGKVKETVKKENKEKGEDPKSEVSGSEDKDPSDDEFRESLMQLSKKDLVEKFPDAGISLIMKKEEMIEIIIKLAADTDEENKE